MADRVLILGASARAAAASARRAGLTPFAVDLFADRDTELLCERVWRCPMDRYPEGLFELARQAPPMPWMYTGGLENYPELVGELAKERELWGNGPDVLRQVRDPFRLSRWLSSWCHGIPHPAVMPAGSEVGEDRVWLRKSLRGSGGGSIRLATPGPDLSPEPDHYFQQFVPGSSMSMAFFGRGDEGFSSVGPSRQLVGTEWLHALPFQYAGNVGPVDAPELNEVLLTGAHLSADIGVRGAFGIDFVHDGEFPTLIEVNPRFPASVEVYELAYGRSLLAPTRAEQPVLSRTVGKAVYYAPVPIVFPAAGPWDESLAHAADVWRRPDFADVPHPGTPIEPGQPVLTLLTDGPTADECVARLKARAADLDRLFGFAPPPE